MYIAHGFRNHAYRQVKGIDKSWILAPTIEETGWKTPNINQCFQPYAVKNKEVLQNVEYFGSCDSVANIAIPAALCTMFMANFDWHYQSLNKITKDWIKCKDQIPKNQKHVTQAIREYNKVSEQNLSKLFKRIIPNPLQVMRLNLKNNEMKHYQNEAGKQRPNGCKFNIIGAPLQPSKQTKIISLTYNRHKRVMTKRNHLMLKLKNNTKIGTKFSKKKIKI